VQKFGRVAVIGQDAAHPRGGEEDGLRFRIGDPGLDIGLAAQVERLAGRREDLAVLSRQSPDQGRAHHAAVAGDPDSLAGQIVQRLTRHGGAPPG
jgi:hypothetical protein